MFILFGHGKDVVLADNTTAMEFLGTVIYREEGIFQDGDREMREAYNSLRFVILQSTDDGATIAYHGKAPTQDKVDSVLQEARLNSPWKFIMH